MYNVQSNALTVFGDLKRDLAQINTSMYVHLRQAGLDAQAAVAFRIQQKGENTAGQKLHTKSPKQTGAYSSQYAKTRTGAGRQVVQVDFTLNGDMMRSFSVLDISTSLVTVGFHDDRQADIAEYLEAYYGETFSLSDSEQNVIINGLIDRLLNDFRI